MKKKFLRGVAAFLAVMMMLPTAALAEDPVDSGNTGTDVPVVVNNTENTESDTTPAAPEFEITCDDSFEVWDNGGKTIQLSVEGYSGVNWQSENPTIATVDDNGVVTGLKGGNNVTIHAQYLGKHASKTITVTERKIESIYIDGDAEDLYVEGETFSLGSASVKANYNDKLTGSLSSSEYNIFPSGKLRPEDEKVRIELKENTSIYTEVDVEVTADAVSSIDIVRPASGKEYKVGQTIDRSEVSIEVSYAVGKPVTLNAEDYSDIKITPSGALEKTNTELTVEYGGKSDKILISVKEDKPAETTSAITNPTDANGYISPTSSPTKTVYTVGEKFDASGMTLYLTYSDPSKNYWFTFPTISLAAFTSASTSTSVTLSSLTDKYGNSFKLKVSGLTVKAGANVTGLDNDTDEYELKDEEDIELKVGDKLNDDVHWYDIFDEVHIIVDGKNKLIDSKSDLDDYPGVELLLRVYKDSSDEIKASHIDDDGKVRLQLYVKNGTTKITDNNKTIREYIPVTEAECTVSIYSSTTSTSSIYLKKTATFEDIYEAFEALEDDDSDAFENAFGTSVSLGSKYAIRIKLGKDQSISKSDVFEPEHSVPVIIDLNGYDLTIYAEKWISYEEDDDFTLTVTNNNSDEDGSLVYRDKSVTLTVAEGSELEFSEGNIPMDSDADCTVSIYKNSNSTSSSYLIKTKVYDDLSEALEALEKQEDVMEDYDIDEDYEDTFVIRIKLGEDQNLSTSTFTFAPDYDTTITIDLNGYTLKLKSEWIDYEDCEDLIVYVNNTNKDKKATLTYTDLSNSLSIAQGDSSLKFEEDEIPGIYDITISSATNGKVTASKSTAAHGGTVTFTITPNAGYAISTVKVGNKSITTSTSGYTVNSSTGVGTYKMEGITADVTITVTFKASSSSSSSSSSSANWTNPFTDVTKNAQYYDAVAFVCSEGLFNGMTATKFEPMTTMTRAMFVTVLGRLADIDVSKYSGTSFTDVSKTDQQISWATPYIEWAVQNGITQGTGNGKFSPNDPITHQQMYLFMYRYAMFVENITTPLTGVSLTSIRDAGEIADWAEEGVKFASKNGILITSGGKLTPADNALRCELAMLLEGFCTKVLGYND